MCVILNSVQSYKNEISMFKIGVERNKNFQKRNI